MGRSPANWSVTCIWLEDPKHKNAAHSWGIPYATDPEMEKDPFAQSIECRICGKKFSLGEEVVLARGKWQGYKYIHKNEAVFDKHANKHYERGYYRTKKGMSP